jgi:hypothetical protein
MARTPQNSTELVELINTLKLQRSAFESQSKAIAAEIFNLAPLYMAGETTAVAKMEQLEQQEQRTQSHVRLCDASIEQALQLLKIMTEREAAAAEQSRKKDYEHCLLLALEQARKADAALAEYSAAMKAREACLEEAQVFALHAHELGQLRSLRSTQGSTWAMGFFDVGRYFEQASLMHRTNFTSLADYSTPRLPGYSLNENANSNQQTTTPDPATQTDLANTRGAKGSAGRRAN